MWEVIHCQKSIWQEKKDVPRALSILMLFIDFRISRVLKKAKHTVSSFMLQWLLTFRSELIGMIVLVRNSRVMPQNFCIVISR